MVKYQLVRDDRSTSDQPPGKSTSTDLFFQARDLLRQERSYLNPNLKKEHICLRLHTTQKALQKALQKQGFHNFPHFINQYRVEEVKNMMAQDEFNIFTLEAIAKMAGFGTRQAFYNSFERLCGMKPAHYRRMVKAQAINEAKRQAEISPRALI